MGRIKALGLFTIVVLSVLAGVGGTASAQLLTQDRCSNAYGITSAQAQARYAWALHCRSNPAPDAAGQSRPGAAYLTDASVTAHNTASAAQRPWLFPVYFNYVGFAPWDVPDGAGTDCYLLPTSATNVGLCVAGCYEESTPLQFADGSMGIKAAFQAGKADLVTLAETATLDDIQFTENRVEAYTVDKYEDWQQIYTLSMSSGGTLRVTNEHPLLTSDGVMHQAQGLRVGDQLVRADGTPDAIVKIETDRVFGKVYNVKPVTEDYTSNIVVAGGYLNGSQRYQNEFLDQINALILRRALAAQTERLIAD